MEYLNKEIRKMSSMVLMLIGYYYSPSVLTIIGAFLCIEHVYSYSRNNVWDFLGHEWIGLILFIIGSLSWSIIPFIIGWMLMADFEYFNPILYMKEKISTIIKLGGEI